MSIKDNFKVLIDLKKSWFDSFYVFLYYWLLIFSVYFVTMVPITLCTTLVTRTLIYPLLPWFQELFVVFISLVPRALINPLLPWFQELAVSFYYLGSKNSLYPLLPCFQELSVSFISMVTITLCILFFLGSNNSLYSSLPSFQELFVSFIT